MEEEDDDWENISITDLLDNKERERNLLEQRKLMEEADIKLSEELFSDDPNPREIKVILERPINISIKNKTKKKNKEFLEKRQEEIRKKQIEASQKKREQNEYQIRAKEIYGEAINYYDNNHFISIEDKYC